MHSTLRAPLCRPPRGVTLVADEVLSAAARAESAINAANRLLADGYIVTSIQTEARCVPVVWLAFDRRLQRLVDHDIACYYRQGIDKNGPYRVGQFWCMNCLAQWCERPGDGDWRH